MSKLTVNLQPSLFFSSSLSFISSFSMLLAYYNTRFSVFHAAPTARLSFTRINFFLYLIKLTSLLVTATKYKYCSNVKADNPISLSFLFFLHLSFEFAIYNIFAITWIHLCLGARAEFACMKPSYSLSSPFSLPCQKNDN